MSENLRAVIPEQFPEFTRGKMQPEYRMLDEGMLCREASLTRKEGKLQSREHTTWLPPRESPTVLRRTKQKIPRQCQTLKTRQHHSLPENKIVNTNTSRETEMKTRTVTKGFLKYAKRMKRHVMIRE